MLLNGNDSQQNLTFKNYIVERLSKSDRLIKCLYPMLNQITHLSLENKIIIYQMNFRPILTYASVVRANAAE